MKAQAPPKATRINLGREGEAWIGYRVWWRGVVGHEEPREVTIESVEPVQQEATIDGGRIVRGHELFLSERAAREAHSGLIDSHLAQVRRWSERVGCKAK